VRKPTTKKSLSTKLVALLMGVAIIASACSDDDAAGAPDLGEGVTPTEEPAIGETPDPVDLPVDSRAFEFALDGAGQPTYVPLPLDPEGTFLAPASVDAGDFRIIFSPGASNQFDDFAELVPPTVDCANDVLEIEFPDSCLAIPREVTVDETVNGVRFITREGEFTQTTATLAVEADLVRVVGDCDIDCVRNGVSLLQQNGEALVDVSQ